MVLPRFLPAIHGSETFVALDFETADPGADSACALAMVRVEGQRIVDRQSWLIRPPRPDFTFTHIHHLTWEHVERERPFAEVWADARVMLHGANYLAAHNASFDRGVLETCCRGANLEPPPFAYLCSLRMSRRVWTLPAYRLPDVSGHLGIALNHHDALSDAEACAQVIVAAKAKGGWTPHAFFL